MSFIDFAELKARIGFSEVVARLNLEGKQSGNQWRGPCITCNSGGDRALIITEGKGAYCFALKKGGDQIWLTAHILDVSVKQAAEWLSQPTEARHVTSTSRPTSTVPAAPPAAAPVQAPDDSRLEKVAARLIHEHSEVQALGLSPARAEALSVGYIKNGVLAGRVLFPLYEDGNLVGFLGFAKDLVPVIKFPKNLLDESQTNVVALKR